MSNFSLYLLLIILIIYIISPWDIHPHFFDDLGALGILYYLWRKYKKYKRPGSYYYSKNKSRGKEKNEPDDNLDLEDAYGLLGLKPDASWEEVQKAYKEKIAKSHPDKVAHLSEELQKKAEELTLKLNNALDIIRCHKNV
jgi:hypothetical protein